MRVYADNRHVGGPGGQGDGWGGVIAARANITKKLIHSINTQDINLFEQALNQGADPNHRLPTGDSPLLFTFNNFVEARINELRVTATLLSCRSLGWFSLLAFANWRLSARTLRDRLLPEILKIPLETALLIIWARHMINFFKFYRCNSNADIQKKMFIKLLRSDRSNLAYLNSYTQHTIKGLIDAIVKPEHVMVNEGLFNRASLKYRISFNDRSYLLDIQVYDELRVKFYA